MDSTKIGMNYAFFKKEVHLGDKVGSFNTKAEAVESAKQHKGSEIISQNKDSKWEVSELKNQSLTLGRQSDIETYDKNDIAFDTLNLKERDMENVSISFVEDDFNYVPPEHAKKRLISKDESQPSLGLAPLPESKNKIGVDYTYLNKDIDLGKKIGSFKSKEDAVAKAQKHKGSEIISQNKDSNWEVRELIERSPILGTPLHIGSISSFNIAFDTYKLKQKDMSNVEISFVDQDLKK